VIWRRRGVYELGRRADVGTPPILLVRFEELGDHLERQDDAGTAGEGSPNG
jgi:hypothetical protein